MVTLFTTFLTSASPGNEKNASKGSNKKSSAVNLVKVRILKTEHRYNLQQELNILEAELSSFVVSFGDFFET